MAGRPVDACLHLTWARTHRPRTPTPLSDPPRGDPVLLGQCTVPLVSQYDGDDFYCDVAIPHPDQLDVVHEDDLVLAFHHTRPFWETHIVIVPKQHISSLASMSSADEAVARRLFGVIQTVAAETERVTGAAAVLTNLGSYQDSKHLHVHVHSGSRR